MRFASKIAVITGGGTGIGRAAAEALVHEGAKVVINGRRENVLAATAKAIDPSGRSVAAHAGDIGRPETAAAIVSLAQQRFGGVDILMNNAGIFAPKPFMDHTEDDFDRFVATILKGKFFMAQAAAGAMKARGGGAIVQTGSMWALQAIAATPSAAYSLANAGVHQMVKNLAIELSPSSPDQPRKRAPPFWWNGGASYAGCGGKICSRTYLGGIEKVRLRLVAGVGFEPTTFRL
jgi:NAD(P)-dependent dehydrogenase (short-subunit alcohol dehydrogenase family)